MIIANVLQPLIDVAESILRFYHDSVGLSWGVSIIALTFTVRLAILPLTFKGVKGMQELQRLQPEIKKIQERYKDDRQRMQQETMKFYQEHKVNPLSSCMPLVLQIPFFISLFYMLRKDLKTDICPGISEFARAQGKSIGDIACGQVPNSADPGFLFIPDLTTKATGAVLITLIVLYVATQLGASLVTAISADKNQRYIMLALPFLFVFFVLSFPAGLLVYWITTNVWTVGQQLAVKKLFPKPEPLDLGLSKNGGKGDSGGSSREDGGSRDGGGGKGKAADAADTTPAPKQGIFASARALAEGRAATGGGAAKTAAKTSAKGNGSGGNGSSGNGSAGNGGPRKAPPPSPRKKKKRSGRRR